MLKQRVITAVLLLILLLPALFMAEPGPFCALVLVLIGAGAWEWARLNGYSHGPALLAALACALACLASWALGWLSQALPGLWSVAGMVWVLGGAWVLRQGALGWAALDRRLRLFVGLWALWTAWLAVAQARTQGTNFVMSLLALVWVADVAAYFAGRAWGGRFSSFKLAPAISPGKSWEGVWGGLAGVLLLALAWLWADRHWPLNQPSWYTQLARDGLPLMLLGVVFLAAMSVVGDLLESLVKRSVGVKDSSALLPGHGGVLDRLDALLPTLPLAMMLSQPWGVR